MARPNCGALPPPADDAPIPGLLPAAWPAVASFLHINDPGLLAVGMASAGTKALLDEFAADHWAIAEEYRAQQEERDHVAQMEFDAAEAARASSEEFSDC